MSSSSSTGEWNSAMLLGEVRGQLKSVLKALERREDADERLTVRMSDIDKRLEAGLQSISDSMEHRDMRLHHVERRIAAIEADRPPPSGGPLMLDPLPPEAPAKISGGKVFAWFTLIGSALAGLIGAFRAKTG